MRATWAVIFLGQANFRRVLFVLIAPATAYQEPLMTMS